MPIEQTLERIAVALEKLANAGATNEPPAPAAPAPAATPLPFNDSQGLVNYVMGKYQSLGPEKGQQIQGIMTNLGYANINDVQPEHFQAFYNQVEMIQ